PAPEPVLEADRPDMALVERRLGRDVLESEVLEVSADTADSARRHRVRRVRTGPAGARVPGALNSVAWARRWSWSSAWANSALHRATNRPAPRERRWTTRRARIYPFHDRNLLTSWGRRRTPTYRRAHTHGPLGGFGYDPLFYSEELHMTFGEAPPAAKHRVSHRG